MVGIHERKSMVPIIHQQSNNGDASMNKTQTPAWNYRKYADSIRILKANWDWLKGRLTNIEYARLVGWQPKKEGEK